MEVWLTEPTRWLYVLAVGGLNTIWVRRFTALMFFVHVIFRILGAWHEYF